MLHASFDVWYSCLQVMREKTMPKTKEFESDTTMQKTKYFERLCEDCDNYYKLSQDVRIVQQNGDAVFTRDHYETLSSYLHVFVEDHLKTLRRECPEWAFVLSEFHNFVIDHEMQRLQVGWVYGGVGEGKNLLFRIQSL